MQRKTSFNSSSYSKISLADDDDDTLHTVAAVAIPMMGSNTSILSNDINKTIDNMTDSICFEYDWDRYRQEQKSEKLKDLYLSTFVAFVILMMFPFTIFSTLFILFLLYHTVLPFSYALITKNHETIPCPKTSIIHHQGLYHSCSNHGDIPGYSIFIPFSEIEDINITIVEGKMARVTITTKSTEDGAEYVQSGVPRFDEKSKSEQKVRGRKNEDDDKTKLTLVALSEPYVFRKKIMEGMNRNSKQNKLEGIIQRIDDELQKSPGMMMMSPLNFLSEISVELKALNSSSFFEPNVDIENSRSPT